MAEEENDYDGLIGDHIFLLLDAAPITHVTSVLTHTVYKNVWTHIGHRILTHKYTDLTVYAY